MTSLTPPTPPMPAPVTLDLTADPVVLTQALCDIPSVSGDERAIADAVERALRGTGHLEVLRHGDAVVARTALGRDSRVVVAGHLDTVPLTDPPNLPVQRREGPAGEELWGRGTVDMKGGVGVMLALAGRVTEPAVDVTWVFYDHEEVASDLNGLGRLVERHPDWVRGDLAILMEPTSAGIEGGCNGTLRVEVRVPGVAAHSARAWMGRNAVHGAADVLTRLSVYEPRVAEVDGLTYREGLNAVGIRGGVAGNVIPDECVVTVNFRFAPDRDVASAEAHVREVFDGYEVTLTDAAPGARPGLDHPLARALAERILARTGGAVEAKQGWTDVARFSALGVPALNFGPGDPLLAHKDDEHCPTSQITSCYDALESWLAR